MFLVISLLLVAQGSATSKPLWASLDTLIEDSLGPNVDFAADYNYSNGNIYIACTPDSGTYFGPDDWGILLFRSTDHGLSWDLLYSDNYETENTLGKEIDIVVTRNDTAYILLSWHNKSGGDEIGIAKVYEGGSGIWQEQWITPGLIATEVRCPKLVRDDFDDFYLYMTYYDILSGNDSIHILRSTDRGYNWDLLGNGWAVEYQDFDIAVADSTIYILLTFQNPIYQTLHFGYFPDRMNDGYEIRDLFSVDTTIAEPVQYPRIGVTTTLPDSEQLVYAFCSQENPGGGHDLLYLYSQNGGDTWTSTPDTLVKGSYSPIICDLRGIQSSPNKYMDLTYCFTTLTPSFENFRCWASEDEPINWQGIASVGTGTYSSIPELIYSPGAPTYGEGIIYNDVYGNLWFDARWLGGITEDTDPENKKIRSQIVLAGSIVEAGSAGATVYDVTGREIITLNTSSWDLKDGKGKEVKTGIYFIVDKENGNKLKLSIIK